MRAGVVVLSEPAIRTEGRPYSEPLALTENGEAFLKHTRQTWRQIEQNLIEITGAETLAGIFHSSYDIVQGLGANPPFSGHLHLAKGQDDDSERP